MVLVKRLFKRKKNVLVKRRKAKTTTKALTKTLNKVAPMTHGPFKMYDDKDPIKPYMDCKFTYAESIGLITGAAGIVTSQQSYNLNSLYDPDKTGVGHQPYYYDQLAVLYQRYKVKGCLVELEWLNPTEDGLNAIMMVQPSSQTVVSLNGFIASTLIERPQVVVRGLESTGPQRMVIKQYFDIAALEGMTKLAFEGSASDEYCANYNANPAATPTISLGISSANGVSGATMQCNVRLTYYARVYERIQPNQS